MFNIENLIYLIDITVDDTEKIQLSAKFNFSLFLTHQVYMKPTSSQLQLHQYLTPENKTNQTDFISLAFVTFEIKGIRIRV